MRTPESTARQSIARWRRAAKQGERNQVAGDFMLWRPDTDISYFT
jgi:hypothetical protein